MTSAKPHSMAAQTEAPDDLIAELARLMADDARGNQPPAKEQPAPVRIPGTGPEPVPRFDFSAKEEQASPPEAPHAVRIPGGATPAAEAPDAFSFNFGFTPGVRSAGPTTPVVNPMVPPQAQAAAHAPREEQPAQAPHEEQPELDQDSLADLIAAELAADMDAGGEAEESAKTKDPAEPVAPAVPQAGDNFAVPPVFGLGSGQAQPVRVMPQAEPETRVEPRHEAPAAPASAPDNVPDPLDDIERLVGPALNIQSGRAAPAPALRSLATPTIPEPSLGAPRESAPYAAASRVEPSLEVSSVDEAILAAAAATGAHVEWVNAGVSEGEGVADDIEPVARPSRAGGFRMSRAVAGPLVAVGLLAAAGGGLYWVVGQGGGSTGPAPLLVADTAPTKEVPVVEETASASQSVVFNEMSGNNSSADEQIVSRDQADTVAVVSASNSVSGSGVIGDASGNTVDPNQDGLVNRKVRTVTVRPDGTIVSGDDSVAGSAILPVDRPNVPDVPGADFSTPELVASAQASAASPLPETTAQATPTPAVPQVEPGAVVPVVDAAGAPISGRSVTIPMQRPADFSAIASAAIAAANAAPTAAPAAAATAPQAAAPAPSGGTAAAYVQLASQRSEQAARDSAQAVATRYGVLFGGASPEIQRVDLGERGIYYRVLVPAASRESASNICTNVRAAGGDCLLL